MRCGPLVVYGLQTRQSTVVSPLIDIRYVDWCLADGRLNERDAMQTTTLGWAISIALLYQAVGGRNTFQTGTRTLDHWTIIG